MITVRRIFAAASLALCMTAFNACVKEAAPEQLPVADENLVEITFEAPSVGVKSTFDGDTRKINWELTDKVAVYDGTAKRQFSITNIEDGMATLRGSVAADATEFYAVYPYSAAGEELPIDGAVNINVPQEQTLAEGKNFDEDAFVTVGKVEDGNIAFKNVVSLLKLNIPADVTSVKLISYSTEKFAGAATATTDRTTTEGDAASVVLKPSAATFTAGEHYIALLPTTFDKGFRVVYEQASQLGVSKTTSKVVFPVNGGQSITGSTPSWIPTVIMNETQLRNYFANQDLFGATEVKLGQNIALTSAWTPVALTGTFDGQNNTISGVNVEAVDNAGMFSLIDTDASLKNIIIEGTIKQTSASADQKGAGLAAELKGTMYKVINKTNVESVAGKWVHVGGLVGNIKGGSVVECDNQGTVILNGTAGASRAGGVFGFMNSGVVQDCTNSGMVTSNLASAEGFGGIGGLQQGGNVQSCTNTGSVVVNAAAANSYAGGVVGYVQNRSKQKLTISGCVNKGEISGANKLKAIGGIVGVIHRYCTSSSEIIGCTNEKLMTAEITKTEFYLGGIVGRMANPGDQTAVGNYVNYIKNNISSGNVSVIKSNAAQTSALFVGGVLGIALGTVELVGNKTLAEMVSLSDGYANNSVTVAGGIVAKMDDTSVTTLTSNVNKSAVTCASTRGNNYRAISGGLIGICMGTLTSSNNINFGDVTVSNKNGGSNKNPMAGGLYGELQLSTGETASLTGDKTFGYVYSDCGRAGLCSAVANATVVAKDCVVGGKLNCPTNSYLEKEITSDNFDDNKNLLMSYSNNWNAISNSGLRFGLASDYDE